MGTKSYIAAAAVAAVSATGAMAATVSIDAISASFGDPTPASFTAFSVNNGAPGDPSSISWGVPANNANQQSSYVFTPNAALPAILAENTAFSLGTFTHNNFTIQSNPGSISGVPLSFSFTGTPVAPAPGPQTTFPATFNFVHNETTNTNSVGNCGGSQQTGTPCDDLVSFVPVGGADEVITVGDVTYTFTVLGFGDNVGGVPDFLDPTAPFLFVTEEGQANSTDLWFEYSVEVVPLPAAGWLMLAGLGALGAVGRRRKAAA